MDKVRQSVLLMEDRVKTAEGALFDVSLLTYSAASQSSELKKKLSSLLGSTDVPPPVQDEPIDFIVESQDFFRSLR